MITLYTYNESTGIYTERYGIESKIRENVSNIDGEIFVERRPSVTHVYESGEWVDDLSLKTEQQIQQLELERDRLLKGTDWYAVRMLENGTDIPVEVSEYRESLRTIDELEGYPDIELPEQPDGVKFVY